MIHINYEQIKEVIRQKDLFAPVKQAFIDYVSPNLIGIPVNLLHFENDADAHIKTAAIKGYDYFSIKVATMFPDNRRQNLSPFDGAIFLFDAATGAPKAILQDKGLLTDLRTAAAGAIITDHIAPNSSRTVGLIGTGIQAGMQIKALQQLRQIKELFIYGRSQAKAEALQKRLISSLPNAKIALVDSAEKAVTRSTIIFTTTSSKSPLIMGDWLQSGQHITAVGADDSYKHELDAACFTNADRIYVDSIELNKQFGEISHLYKDKPILEKTIEFGHAFSNHDSKNDGSQITVAKLVGVGVQDLAAASMVMKKLGY
jgi:ornithine cyclodeaminase